MNGSTSEPWPLGVEQTVQGHHLLDKTSDEQGWIGLQEGGDAGDGKDANGLARLHSRGSVHRGIQFKWLI